DEVGEGSLKHRGRLVDDELDLSFEGAVVALDLAVGLRVVGGGDDVADAEQPEVGGEGVGEVAGAVVGEECGTVAERHLRHARLLHRVLDHLDQRARGHVRLQAPGQDEAAVVVEDGDQVVVAPAGYLEVGAVAGPHLVGARGLAVVLLLGSEAQHFRWLHEAVALEQGRGSHERDQGCFFSRLHASVPRPQSNSGSAVFLRTSTSSESSATSCFSCSFSLLKPSTSARVASRTVSACSLDLPASMKSLSHE